MNDDESQLVGDLRRSKRKDIKLTQEPGKAPPEVIGLAYLVVDDEKPMRTLIRNALHNYGVQDIVEAPNIDEASMLLEQRAFDVILVDQEMPGMGGAEFVFRLRRGAYPVNIATPIIMITSHLEEEHIRNARNAGVTEFLGKPVSAAALMKRITSAILTPRPMVKEDGYVGPDRRWLKEKPADEDDLTSKLRHPEVLDFNARKSPPKIKK